MVLSRMRLSHLAWNVQTCRLLSTTAVMASTSIVNSPQGRTSSIEKSPLLKSNDTCAIDFPGVSLNDLPKSNTFTTKLPRTSPPPPMLQR